MAFMGMVIAGIVLTIIELEFIQVFVDYGVAHDSQLLLYEDIQDDTNILSQYYVDIEKDENYYKLMEIIGR